MTKEKNVVEYEVMTHEEVGEYRIVPERKTPMLKNLLEIEINKI